MNAESSRRGFLRHASLAGAALVAGASALSVSGCGDKELKKENEKLKAENAELRTLTSQVEVDPSGNLIIHDEQIKARLCEVWKGQEGKEDPPEPSQGQPPSKPRRGIHVVLETCKFPGEPGIPPEGQKVNSLCSC